VAQVVEGLPSKCEALCSNPSITKKKKSNLQIQRNSHKNSNVILHKNTKPNPKIHTASWKTLNSQRNPEQKKKKSNAEVSQYLTLNYTISLALVSHTFNLKYSGDRDQEDHSSKPALANSSQTPVSKIITQKRAARVTQEVECLCSKH
jgi:hypothetical protein